MRREQLSRSRLRRVFAFINETRWIAWGLPLMGIVVVAANYKNLIRPDRPDLQIIEAYFDKASATPTVTAWVAKYQNDGRMAATSIVAKLGTVDLTTKKTALLAPPYKLARLSAQPDFRAATAEFKINQQQVLDLFVVCLSYGDDRGQTSNSASYIYKALPISMSSSDNRCCELADGTPAEHEAMSSWFSCAKL